jgi:hypothetical protein
MTKDLPTWLSEDDDEDRPPGGRRWVLAALATLPWLVVVALLLTGVGPGDRPSSPEVRRTAPSAEAAATPSDVEDGAPAGGGAAGGEARDATASGDDEERSSAPSGAEEHTAEPAAVDPAVAALASAVARAWLTDVGPRLQIEGVQPQADRYLEQAMVEAVDEHDGLAVATVLALVLERDGERYVDVALQRLAVPLRLTDAGPRPAGPPWWLPDPDVRPHLPEAAPEHDPDLALATAELLAEHAYEDVEITHLARQGGGWLIAEVTGRLPDGRPLLGPVWLRETPSGPRLLGSVTGTPGQEGSGPSDATGDHHVPAPDQEHAEEQP